MPEVSQSTLCPSKFWIVVTKLSGYWPLICFNTVQGVSNDVKVVWRFVFSVPFAILLFFVGATSQQYFWFSLGMYLPYILLINLFTWKNYVDFVGTDSGNIAKDAQSMARQRLTSFYSWNYPEKTRNHVSVKSNKLHLEVVRMQTGPTGLKFWTRAFRSNWT